MRKKNKQKNKKIVVVSGFFNPLHIGHLSYLKEAKKLGDLLVVIVNSDEQVTLKGSIPFMDENERIEIVKSLRFVDKTFLSKDKDRTVCKTLEKVRKLYPEKEMIFANGGDRGKKNVPEKKTCKTLGIKMKFGVGGTKKIQSSSSLLLELNNLIAKNLIELQDDRCTH